MPPCTSTTLRPPHLTLNNPMGSLYPPEEPEPESTALPVTPNGLRAHIRHLVPKHALFHVRLVIHQLASVPLVSGQFGVRWKFQDLHSPPGVSTPGILDKVKRVKDAKGKAKQSERNGSESTSNTGSTDDAATAIPSVVVSGHSPSSSRSSSHSGHSAALNPLDWVSASLLSPVGKIGATSAARVKSESTQSLAASTPPASYARTRGMTPWVKLIEHNATWEHTVDAVVQMDVDRDTTNLRPNELKLVVMQRVIPGDIDAPHRPRFGALYLNLAEYADAGSVSRRYLLADSKTNATLKLTIQLEHVGGEKTYKAPPLPKSEILGGITGLLDSTVHRARPPLENLATSSTTAFSSSASIPTTSSPHLHPHHPSKSGGGLPRRSKPFDITMLHTIGADEPASTELLIDALFNPMPTHSEKEVSPFTYYVPKPTKGVPGDWATKGKKETAAESVYSTETNTTDTSSSASVRSWTSRDGSSAHGHGTGQGEDTARGQRWWKRGLKGGESRPATPVLG